jgi:hypothetical protein
MNLADALYASGALRVDQPPRLWEADTNELAFARLLRALLGVSVSSGKQPVDFTLNVSNVTVPVDSADARLAAGDYVAVTARATGDWGPESLWWPGTPTLSGLFGKLVAPLRDAHARFAYVRIIGSESSVTVFFPRLISAGSANQV